MGSGGTMAAVDAPPQKPHLVLVAAAGMGHLIPLAEFAKRLLLHADFSITIATFPGQFQDSTLATWNPQHPGISHVVLPPADTSDLPPGTMMGILVYVGIKRSLDALRQLLLEIGPVSALVFEFMSIDALDVARELRLPAFLFLPPSARVLSWLLVSGSLPPPLGPEPPDLPKLLAPPETPPFDWTAPVDPLYDPRITSYGWMIHYFRRYKEADGIVSNSFDELEPKAIKSLLEGTVCEGGIPPVYPVGPLVKVPTVELFDSLTAESAGEREGCLRWLDEQPRGSVLYVAFGTTWTMTREQMVELALGLEASGQRFLWVVRKPRSGSSAADTKVEQMEAGHLVDFLPEGFLERTAEVGLVVPEWAPQVEVLSHEAVGGFMSHCGWNSTLESLVYGVPVIGFPLHPEQEWNAKTVDAEGFGVVFDTNKGLVGRQEVKRVVRLLMEGETAERLRKRASELKAAASGALSEGGSSYRRLARLARVLWSGELPSDSHPSGPDAGAGAE